MCLFTWLHKRNDARAYSHFRAQILTLIHSDSLRQLNDHTTHIDHIKIRYIHAFTSTDIQISPDSNTQARSEIIRASEIEILTLFDKQMHTPTLKTQNRTHLRDTYR